MGSVFEHPASVTRGNQSTSIPLSPSRKEQGGRRVTRPSLGSTASPGRCDASHRYLGARLFLIKVEQSQFHSTHSYRQSRAPASQPRTRQAPATDTRGPTSYHGALFASRLILNIRASQIANLLRFASANLIPSRSGWSRIEQPERITQRR